MRAHFFRSGVSGQIAGIADWRRNEKTQKRKNETQKQEEGKRGVEMGEEKENHQLKGW
jgi:hypothetical protein